MRYQVLFRYRNHFNLHFIFLKEIIAVDYVCSFTSRIFALKQTYGHLFIEINEVHVNIVGTMAGRLLFSSLRQVQKLQKACVHGRSRIGNREVVGFGFNGQCSYQDRVDFPMPAIRFKENTPDLVVSTNILNI